MPGRVITSLSHASASILTVALRSVGGSTPMRPGASGRATWLLSVLLACLAPVVTWAYASRLAHHRRRSPPVTAPAAVPTGRRPRPPPHPNRRRMLQQALNLERQRNWSAAIELYQQAADQWPDQPAVQPAQAALRVALPARPPLPGPELSQGPAPASAREGGGALRRDPRADRAELRRPGPARAAAAAGLRQHGGRPPRPGLPQGEPGERRPRAGRLAA